MPRTIFVGPPVADVAKATAFYDALGFERDATFPTEQGASMAWSDAIVVMLLDRALYATFTPRRIIDAHEESGALPALSFDSHAGVDAIAQAAIAAGGREAHSPEDPDSLYSRAFEDLDGHGRGPLYMDRQAAQTAMAGPTDA